MAKKSTPASLNSRILGSKIFIWGGVILMVLIVFALGKAAIRKHDIQTEINSLDDSIGELESKNAELSGLIEYFKTEAFQEREAREKLGLKKPGETVVALATTEEEDAPFFEEEAAMEDVELSNQQKWWDYFFTKQ